MELFNKIMMINKAGELAHKDNIGALSKPLKEVFIEAGIPVSWTRKEKRKTVWDKLPKLYEDGYSLELNCLISTCGEDVLYHALQGEKVKITNDKGVWGILPEPEKDRVNIFCENGIDWYLYL